MEKKSFYAIVPANVRYCKELTPNAKLLYGEITALCNEKGYCWASNEYFSDLYEVSTRTITRWINQLNSLGFVQSTVYKNHERHIRVGGMTFMSRGLDNNVRGVRQECLHNNTTNNTTNNTLTEKEFSEPDNNTDGVVVPKTKEGKRTNKLNSTLMYKEPTIELDEDGEIMEQVEVPKKYKDKRKLYKRLSEYYAKEIGENVKAGYAYAILKRIINELERQFPNYTEKQMEVEVKNRILVLKTYFTNKNLSWSLNTVLNHLNRIEHDYYPDIKHLITLFKV